MPTEIDPKAARALAQKARANGGKAPSVARTEWDVSGRCERPVGVELDGRLYRGQRRDYIEHPFEAGEFIPWFDRSATGETIFEGAPSVAHFLDIDVRCRRCMPCRRYRRRQWEARALDEVAWATRTWFATLTFSPHNRYLLITRARQHADRNGFAFDALTDEARYTELCKQAGKELQLYQKRVRKISGAPLRFLWVFECHEDGFPHVHGLVHEMAPGLPVKHKDLKGQWEALGFTKIRLLTDRAEAAYPVKYLTKGDVPVRIRASQHYGLHPKARPERKRPQGIVDRVNVNSTKPEVSGGVDAKGGSASLVSVSIHETPGQRMARMLQSIPRSETTDEPR